MCSTVASVIDQSILKIYAKMSETKSLLATILVREGFLLVQNRDFLVLEQRDRDFRHIAYWRCGLRREGGSSEPNELPLDLPLSLYINMSNLSTLSSRSSTCSHATNTILCYAAGVYFHTH